MRKQGQQASVSYRPFTQQSASRNLPSIFDNPAGQGLFIPLRNRPTSGLRLDIKALPNTGFVFSTAETTTTTTTIRPIEHRLSNSDTTADRLRHARKPQGDHGSTNNNLLHHRRNSQPTVPDRRIDAFVIGGGAVGGESINVSRFSPVRDQTPLKDHLGGHVRATLPPIGTESVDSGQECRHGMDGGEEGVADGDDDGEYVSSSDGSDSDEDYLNATSEAPPSKPGFESDAEKSAETFQIPFPDVNVSSPFPATLIQDQAQQDNERFAAAASVSGVSPRVNNIVRAFRVHGPLDKDLLTRALNKVANLHPLLSASFQRLNGRLYVQTPPPGAEELVVDLEVPLIGHEQVEDLILNARRKIFPITMSGNMGAFLGRNKGDDTNSLLKTMSLASIGDINTSSTDSSPMTETAGTQSTPSSRKKVVFVESESVMEAETETEKREEDSIGESPPAKHKLLPSLGPPPNEKEKFKSPLIRVRLVSKTRTNHILVMSFPRIICDFWSSCLFMHQVTDLYTKLERSASYKPSAAVMRLESKKQEMMDAYDRERRKNSQGRRLDAATRLMQMRKQQQVRREASKDVYVPTFPAKLHFHQVAQRENQLILMIPRERLLAFWEGMVTATIKRERGVNRLKVVPPVRIPSGLGEATATRDYGRPQTSRLRPLTASRNRPTTARRQAGGGGFGEMKASRDALLGAKTVFHFLKIEDEVCETFKLCFPETHQNTIPSNDLCRLFTLGVFILLLGKCCRGWGMERHMTIYDQEVMKKTENKKMNPQRTAEESAINFTPVTSRPTVRSVFTDPLQKYKAHEVMTRRQQNQREQHQQPVMGEGQSPKLRGDRKGTRLDAGSFLIGVEVSLRNSEPNMTEGLFGPLTNDAAIRVNLSSSETFVELMQSLSRSLKLVGKHGHQPFAPVADEVGLMNGLPIRFSYQDQHHVTQLSNPNKYFYMETAIGVADQGLGRLGSHCYLTPLNSKMDDSCHFELHLWESYDHNTSLAGGIRYQPQVIRADLVQSFGVELCHLMRIIASNPSIHLLDLAREIKPPFLSTRSKTRGRRGLNQKVT